jgi:hypothetical protein
MIGSSLPLCYPQIVVSDLLDHRAFRWIPPLTKHIRLGVCAAFSSVFLGPELVPSKWRCHIPPTAANAHR